MTKTFALAILIGRADHTHVNLVRQHGTMHDWAYVLWVEEKEQAIQ